ncbi:putative ATPase, AAA-type, core, nucleoporin, nucleoporin, protein [Helianthus annuus]|nr:putative ATPase, AAA-type, core, nucleoporin, nucleoporin, protein [Helianthus annuus]
MDGQCPEYSGEEQAICVVGLVKTKPGIFVEAIQYLLVLATPVELFLIGVCCSGSGDGSDPYAEVSVQSLPEYRIPSDGVTMTCIACTNRGHIFLAGHDGHIYELHYTTLYYGFRLVQTVSCSVPNVFKFGAVDPVVGMDVDNETHLLYARTEEMKIQVYSLGQDGNYRFLDDGDHKLRCIEIKSKEIVILLDSISIRYDGYTPNSVLNISGTWFWSWSQIWSFVLDIDLSWRMHKVSDGQRRRVQICMSLLKEFKVLLLDEITIDLDVLARADLLTILEKECEERGATIIYATHI